MRGLLWALDPSTVDFAVPAVVEGLHDAAWRVREKAAQTVARHFIDLALPALVALRDDPAAVDGHVKPQYCPRRWGSPHADGLRGEVVADVREEVSAWLDEHWDPDLTVRAWWQRLADAGWAFPTWPREWYGRGLGNDALKVASQVFEERNVLGAPSGLGQTMGGPVVIQHGNDDQRRRLASQVACGAEGWCQFFSEPGAGSDLASAQTRAVRDGDEWIVNGQKVWTSGALSADRGMLLARVNPDAPKHRGLGYFIIEVDQPGIEIRPLKQMTGASPFNEVFFTDARVSDADLIGRPGDGWAAAVTTLAYERGGRAGVVGAAGAGGGARRGVLDQRAGDVVGPAPRLRRPAAQGRPNPLMPATRASAVPTVP